jgi:hypothetical protein
MDGVGELKERFVETGILAKRRKAMMAPICTGDRIHAINGVRLEDERAVRRQLNGFRCHRNSEQSNDPNHREAKVSTSIVGGEREKENRMGRANVIKEDLN